MEFLTNIKEILNNREIAFLIWFLILLVFSILKKEVRDAFKNVIKMKILWYLIISTLIYNSIIILFLFKLKIWNIYMLKDTIIWVITAVTLLFQKLHINDYNFKKIIIENLGLNILIEFIVNLYCFSLLGEIIFLPIMFILLTTSIITKNKKECKQVYDFLNMLLSIIGLIVIFNTVNNIILNIHNINYIKSINDLLLQPVLTILFIPCIYLWGFVIELQNIYVHIKNRENINKPKLLLLKITVYSKCNLNKIRTFWQLKSFDILYSENEKQIEDLIIDHFHTQMTAN